MDRSIQKHKGDKESMRFRDWLNETKMGSAQIDKLKKEYEPMRGKKISMANTKKLQSLFDKIEKDKELLMQLVKADIPFVSTLARTRLISKHGGIK